MELHADLLEPLLIGLSTDDKAFVLQRLESARDEQLDRKLNPPRRRRRDADGVLRWPDELADRARLNLRRLTAPSSASVGRHALRHIA